MTWTRKTEYAAGTGDDGLKVSQFLRRRGYSRQNLIRLKQTENSVLVNGVPSRLNGRLRSGDNIQVIIAQEQSSPEVTPVYYPLDILYEDEDLLAVNKPAGMPVHPSRGNRDNTLANALAWYFRQKNEPFVFRCSNRLDRDTSGVIVVARHALSGCMLSEMGVRREIGREYLGIVRGLPDPPSGIINVPIGRKPGSIIERTVDPEHGETACTHYRVLSHGNGHSLLWLKLETGRTHQIRIHLKYLGWPLVGDYLYNPDTEFIHRQALHSWRMSFFHPITGEKMCFTAPLPGDMAGIVPDPGIVAEDFPVIEDQPGGL